MRFIGLVSACNSRILAVLGLLAGLGPAACVFTPPPPLPEELAEAGDPASAKGTAPGAGAATAGGEVVPEGTFTKGDPPAVGMSDAEMQAYAKAQGDPKAGVFTLDEAVGDVEGEGTLWAVLELPAGRIECELFEQQAPKTVANFTGLARGKRPFKDPEGEDWIQRPYYDGTLFHRAIPGFMIQGGDPLGTGQGGPGYVIPDELVPGLSHDRAGRLSMANRGAGTGGGQFFVTLGPTLHLDGVHTIFGQCTEASISVAEALAASAGSDDRPSPEDRATITRVTIERR